MNTPTQRKRSSASSTGMTPSATLSATALATAYCAAPNICRACLAPRIVTLLNMTVAGLTIMFGASSASTAVKPSLLLTRQFAKAVSTVLPRGPMIRSIWATSFPSPTSASPTRSPLIFAICCVCRIGFLGCQSGPKGRQAAHAGNVQKELNNGQTGKHLFGPGVDRETQRGAGALVGRKRLDPPEIQHP